MLYVTNAELKSGYPLPPGEWLDIVLKSTETIADYRKQGKILVHAGWAGRQGGTIFWDVESHEELMQRLTNLPFWPFLSWEIIPALTTEQTLASIKQSQASL